MSMNLPATTGKPQSPPQWLDGFKVVTEDCPTSREEVQALTAAARRALQLASPQEIGRELDKLALLYSHMMPSNFLTEQVPQYLELLSDLPPDLLTTAMTATKKQSSYWPKPADIRKFGNVDEELNKRSAALLKLELILKIGKFKEPDRKPKTPEELAEAGAMVDRVRAVLSGTAEGMNP